MVLACSVRIGWNWIVLGCCECVYMHLRKREVEASSRKERSLKISGPRQIRASG